MKVEVGHPSGFLNKELTDTIRNTALAAERSGRLHENQLDIIYQQQWLKMFVPCDLNGLGLSLPDILKIEECLSWADGSTAWVVTLCSGAGWFVGFISPDLREEIFRYDRCCIAGSGATTGIAVINENGYEITGLWKYASGALHATAFTVNCYVNKEGQQIYNADGLPLIRSFLLKRDEVKIISTWTSMGLIATGTHSFEIDKLQVSLNRCFTIEASFATLKQPIYQFPFLQLAETTLAMNMSGMAMRFIDLCRSKSTQKKQSDKMIHLINASEDELNEIRNSFYKHIASAWVELESEHQLSNDMLLQISALSHEVVRRARWLVNELYPFCGLEAANKSTEINRVWRNFHTAGQHALFVKQ